jgi:hypothetical protein
MADDDVLFELDEWEEPARAALTTALTDAGIEHSWESTTLVVSADDEDRAELVMDRVDDELALALDPSADHVAYDLSAWTDEQRVGLAEVLAEAGIANGWDGDELFVHAIDEQRVDELFANLADPDAALEADAAGGFATAEAMSELFVAADRLMNDPEDHEGTLSLIDASRAAAGAAAPYGIDEALWGDVVGAAGALATLVSSTDADLDVVIEQATALRQALRPLV